MNCRALVVLITLLIGFPTFVHAEDEVPSDQVPMYGGMNRSAIPELKAQDDKFITDTTTHFGTREKASLALGREGDAQMARRDLIYAMKRYNQSWLLNPNNYWPYWGFARIMLEKDKMDDSIKYFELARKLCDDTLQMPAIISDEGAAYSYMANSITDENNGERANNFKLANELFLESTKLDPEYKNSWKQWAFSLYREGNYAASWEKINKARSLGATNVDFFLGNLTKKMPAPH